MAVVLVAIAAMGAGAAAQSDSGDRAARDALQKTGRRLFSDRWERPITFNDFRKAFQAPQSEEILSALNPREWARLGEGRLSPAHIFAAFAREAPRPAPVSTSADAIIVGSGLSGLKAAQELRSMGKSVIVLEASDVVGGRIRTVQGGFSTKVDLGAMCLMNHPLNPLTPLARKLGFTLTPEPIGQWFLYDGTALSVEKATRFEAATDEIGKLLESKSLGRKGQDLDFWDVVKSRDVWLQNAARYWDQTSFGVRPQGGQRTRISTRDIMLSSDERPYMFIKEGIGAFVDYHKLGLRIELDQPVTEIIPDKSGVTVKTREQAYHGKTVVITAPPSRLRDITLGLSALDAGERADWAKAWNRKLEAAHQTQGASFVKIILEFDSKFQFPASPPGTYISDISRPERMIEIIFGMNGQNVVQLLTGGRFAHELNAMSEQDAVTFAKDRLKEMYGRTHGPEAATAIERAFRHGARTPWVNSPWIRFAWHISTPGNHFQRNVLAEPIGGRLFMGGEASVSREWQGTINGAYVSGIRASREVLALASSRLGRLKTEASNGAKGTGYYVAASGILAGAHALAEGDAARLEALTHEMKTPEYWGSMAAFVPASMGTERLLRLAKVKPGGVAATGMRLAVPVFVVSQAMAVVRGEENPRQAAVSASSFGLVGTGMAKAKQTIAQRLLQGPGMEPLRAALTGTRAMGPYFKGAAVAVAITEMTLMLAGAEAVEPVVDRAVEKAAHLWGAAPGKE